MKKMISSLFLPFILLVWISYQCYSTSPKSSLTSTINLLEQEPSPITTKKELERIRKLDFPECKNVNNIDKMRKCIRRIQLESVRIAKITVSKSLRFMDILRREQKISSDGAC